MAEKLNKILNIDGIDYAVTAAEADVAAKLANKLTINTVVDGAPTKVGEFDGSKADTINIEIPSVDDFITEIPNTYATKEYVDEKISEIPTGGGTGGNSNLAEKANKIRVNIGDVAQEYATITISTAEPKDGAIGDIWFKY